MKTKVNWNPWNLEQFKKAKKEDKPILLDLYGSWCHWCHQMDKDCYDNNEIASLINRNFIPVKVNIDERPDIKERYNLGGFPTTAFLDHKGRLLTGGTYFPPEQFLPLLNSVKKDYKTENFPKQPIQEHSSSCKSQIDESIIQNILGSLLNSYDKYYGGFGTEPKFPIPDAINLLSTIYKKKKNREILNMITNTLNNMTGIEDREENGFFRYSVAVDWSIPHYEKMLDTNSGMINNYALGYELTKDEKYKKVGERTIKYIKENLTGDQVFYSSQEADEEYYKAKERRLDKPPVDKSVYTDWNTMMVSSFLYAGKIFNKKEYSNLAIKILDNILYLNFKNNQMNHCRNTKGLTTDQAYTIKALLDAYYLTKEDKYIKYAEKLIRFLITNMKDKKLGGFFDKTKDYKDIGRLKQREKSLFENSIIAESLLRLYKINKKKSYLQLSEKTLLAVSCDYEKYGYHAAGYANSVELFLQVIN